MLSASEVAWKAFVGILMAHESVQARFVAHCRRERATAYLAVYCYLAVYQALGTRAPTAMRDALWREILRVVQQSYGTSSSITLPTDKYNGLLVADTRGNWAACLSMARKNMDIVFLRSVVPMFDPGARPDSIILEMNALGDL